MRIIRKAVQIKNGKIPLAAFEDWRRIIPVFEIRAKSDFTPIDLNLSGSSRQEPGWTDADRLRFWTTSSVNSEARLTIRKVDLEIDAICHCSISLDGSMRILGNDKKFTEDFFRSTFTRVPPSLKSNRHWKTRKGWIGTKFSTMMLAAHIAGAMGWRNSVPSDIVESLSEATSGFKSKNWLSCLVMCRRAAESIVRFAYTRSFGKESRGLDMNDILREFEDLHPPIIPKHWISLLDSVRHLGNVPGAHAQKGAKYKIGKVDARTALRNVLAFEVAYFSKIDPNISGPTGEKNEQERIS